MNAGSVLALPGAVAALWVPLPALRSKSNFRRGTSTNWNRLSSFEDDVARLVRAARPHDWPMGEKEAPVAARPAVVACVLGRTTLDAGNLSKSVLDAVQGVMYHSDASVRWTIDFVERAAKDQHGAAGFAVCAEGTDAVGMLTVAHDLAKATLLAWQNG